MKTKTLTKTPLLTSSTREQARGKTLTQRTGVRAGGSATWNTGPSWYDGPFGGSSGG